MLSSFIARITLERAFSPQTTDTWSIECLLTNERTYLAYSERGPVVHSALDAEPPGATAFKVHRERLHSSATAVRESIQLQLQTRSKLW